MNLNLLEIIVALVLLLLVISGMREGLARKLASMLSLVITIGLVSVLLPYMTSFLKEKTPVYDVIATQCEKVVKQQLQESLEKNAGALLSGVAGNGQPASGTAGAAGEEGQTASGIGATAAQLAQSLSLDELTGAQQNSLIELLPLPEFVKTQLEKHNNREDKRLLEASTFLDYIVNYLSTAILNVVSFVLVVVLVQLLVKLVIRALDLLTRVPGIHLLNRLAGGALGLVEGLFLLWLFFLVLSVFSATDWGLSLISMVQESRFLGWLYESNLFVNIVLRAAAVFGV